MTSTSNPRPRDSRIVRHHVAQHRHLLKAPISEALIDVRVQPRADFQAQSFLSLREELSPRFPNAEERRGVTLQLAFGGRDVSPKGEVVSHPVDGVFFRSGDGKVVAQFRADGFTFNRLRPYTSWGEIVPVATELFTKFLTISNPRLVTRVATRFINHLTLPSRNFGRYLSVPPHGVSGVAGDINGFINHVSVRHASGATVNFTQALDQPGGQIGPTILVDVDVFLAGEFESNPAALTETLPMLHDLKNSAFFAAITDDAAALCE